MFVLVSEEGEVLCEIPLGLDGDASQWDTCWLSADRFVITRSPVGVGEKASAWRLDTAAQSLTKLDAFDCASIDCLARLSDDGFSALATARYEYTMVIGLRAFNADGSSRWSLQEDLNGDQSDLFSPEAITVNSAGEIVVVDNIRHTLQFFSQAGQFKRLINLEEAWGRKPEYPSDIAATKDGLIVHDFGSDQPYVVVDGSGKQLSSFVPRYQDGRHVDCVDFTTTTDHRVWVTDRHALMRLNRDGIVDRVVGSELQTRELQDIVMLEIDREGKLYAVDRRTVTTHVFDADFNPLYVCEIAPNDFSGELFEPSLTISDEGNVQICVSDVASRGRYVHFSSSGERMGRFELKDRTWQLQPGTGNGVLVNYEQIELRDPERKLIREIWRRPDGMWLESPESVRFDGQGRFAVLAESKSNDKCSISLFAADASPLQTIVLPHELGQSPRFDFREERIVIVSDHTLVALDLRGIVLGRCTLTHDSTNWPIPRIVQGRREVLISPGKGTLVARYQLP